MKETDIAYIAGLVDGEGYIGIKRSNCRKDCVNPSYQARIQIRMVDEPVIKFIAETLGGWYYKEKPSAAKGRPLFCYQASDKCAANILEILLPYLRVKKESAIAVLNLRKLQSESKKHRTKIVGYRDFPNSHGIIRKVPNLAYSDEYIESCETLWNLCKQLNKVGID